MILIHPGNWAGDVHLGLKSDVQGCILIGRKTGVLDGQHAVLESRNAIMDMKREMGTEPFVLKVRWDETGGIRV